MDDNTRTFLKDHLKNLDLKAEIIFILLEHNSGMKKLPFFFPKSSFKRRFRNDISQLAPSEDFRFNLDRPVMEANRNGLYDLFPEYFFHKNYKNKSFKDISELKENSAFNREIELNTRKFFWPLDHYIFRMKHMVSSLEEIDKVGNEENTSRILNIFWRIPKFFNKEQVKILLAIMPLLKGISANRSWLAETVSLIINEKVEIEEAWEQKTYNSEIQAQMGTSELGISTICGSSIKKLIKKIYVKIGPIENNPITSFISKGMNKKRLDYLLNYLIPADMEVDISLIPLSKKSFILSSKPEDQNILGISTVLN